MKNIKTLNKVLKHLDSEYEDDVLDIEIQKENEKTLVNIGFPKDSLIYTLYKTYDIDCFYFDSEENEGFLFASLALIDDLKDIVENVHNEWGVPKEYIPISDGEAGYYTFYHLDNHKVFFCDIQLSENIPKNSEKTWDSFEDFLTEYLDIS